MLTQRRLIALILTGMILSFSIYFSWYSIQRYQTLHAYTADLSLIDQAIWNTSQGRLLEATWGEQQQPRLAEHFEPILIPIAALFWLWDDVRLILVLQAFALAIGALPVFWLARRTLVQTGLMPAYLALLFPLIYLLSPPLQAAAVADFHTDPLAVAPFLFAFWYASERRWGWLWFWAISVMLTKETMPTLVVMLGGYLLWQSWRYRSDPDRRNLFGHGLGLVISGTLWFAIATFGIVAPLASQYFGSDGPIYLANRFSANPLTWPALLLDPARLRYLLGLLLSTGGLALLAPQYLLLGLPVFIANTFSNFPGQYSGEQHYSAPLVAVLLIAAIYGTQSLFQFFQQNRQSNVRPLRYILLTFAVIIVGIYHTFLGWTPLAQRTETYAVTEHSRLAAHFFAQIPDDVPISASAALHPHLAHRPVAYTFPTIQEAEYILIDITDVPGKHPNDVKTTIDDLLISGEWQLLDAADGFLLLQAAPVSQSQVLPEAFYSFALADEANPEIALNIIFGDQIELLGFDLIDQPFHRQTQLRFYWRALQEDTGDLILWPQLFDPAGQPLSDPIQQPMLVSVWYPPQRWRPNQIIVTETLPQQFVEQFHLGVGVSLSPNFNDPAQRLPVSGALEPKDRDTWAHIASFRRNGWDLEALPPNAYLLPLNAVLEQFEQGLTLTGYYIEPPAVPSEQPLEVTLTWRAATSLSTDYTIFLHLIDQAGMVVAQRDAQPFWLTEQPTSRWLSGQTIYDGHQILPPIPPGRYQLHLGLYDWQTLERLPLQTGEDTVNLGEVGIPD